MEIKKEVIDLSEKIGAELKISKDGSVERPDDLYEKLLPEGITMEQLKGIQAHNTDFIAAATHAFGQAATPVMKKNAELNSISLDIPTVGKDSLSLQFDRSKQVPNGDGGMQTKYGSVSVKYDMYGAGSRGQLKAVKQYLAEEAAKAFSD